jgi:hypothetical protein
MPGVLTRSPDSSFELGPDPSPGVAVLEVFQRLFILAQDSTFAIGLIAIVLGSVYHFSGKRTGSPEYVLRGIYLTTFLFFFGAFLQGVGWLLTGTTRIDESLGLVTNTLSFPAHLLVRAVSPSSVIPTPSASPDYPLHVLGRVFSIEILLFSFFGLTGFLIGVVIKASSVQDIRGDQWARSGLLVTIASLLIHTVLATFAWLITGTTGFTSAKMVSPDYTNTSQTTIHLPEDQLVNTDLIYPLVPSKGDVWPLIHALERSFELTVTTAGWIGLIGVVIGAAIYFGTTRQSDRGHQWIVAGSIVIVVMVSLPLILSTGTWLMTGEEQAFTEVRGANFAASSTFESQTAEGWSAPDGALSIVATNTTRNTFGLHVIGAAHHQYDVGNNVDGEQTVIIDVAGGSADITISVDGTTSEQDAAVSGRRQYTVPDGSRVTVTVEGIDVVIEEVVVTETNIIDDG